MLLTIILGNSRGCKIFPSLRRKRKSFMSRFYGCFQFRFVARLFFSKINKTPALHKLPILRRMLACLCSCLCLREPIKFSLCQSPSHLHCFLTSFSRHLSGYSFFQATYSRKPQEKQIKKFDFPESSKAASQNFISKVIWTRFIDRNFYEPILKQKGRYCLVS